MGRSITLHRNQDKLYKLEIIQVFRPQSYEERREGVERVRLDEPEVVEIGWYDNPTAARNYGSYRTDRREWYNSMPHNKVEYVHVHKETGRVLTGDVYYRLPYTERYEYDYKRQEIPPPYEPDRDYRVYRVPVSLNMGEAVQLPALKKFHVIEE